MNRLKGSEEKNCENALGRRRDELVISETTRKENKARAVCLRGWLLGEKVAEMSRSPPM